MKNSYKSKISALLKILNCSQEKLAQRIGVSFVTLNSWLHGKTTPREKPAALIDELYKKYTGQMGVSRKELEYKWQTLLGFKKKHKNILRTLLSRRDLYEHFLLLLTYNTNCLEGSTLTLSDTRAILLHNQVLKNKTLVEQLEAKNHQAAFGYMMEHAGKHLPLNENLVLQLHTRLMNGIYPDAGAYRRHNVRIAGAYVPIPNHIKVSHLMKNLMVAFEKNKGHLMQKIASNHSVFEKIHPFPDGNGRVGRLLIQAQLLKQGFPLAIIKQEDRQLYLTYLNKAQMTDDVSLLEDFLMDAVLDSYRFLEES